MKNKEILKNDELITKFIGRQGKVRKDLYTFIGVSDINNGDPWFTLEDAKFHTSMDWLMPVIIKIRGNPIVTNVNYNVAGDFIIEGLTKTEVLNIIINREDFKSDLEMIYFGITEFINWYNKNK